MSKEKKEKQVRFKQMLTVPSMTLGFPEPEELIGKTQVLCGLDLNGQPWVLLANQHGTGWTTLKTTLLKESSLVTGGQAIDEMNQLPEVE